MSKKVERVRDAAHTALAAIQDAIDVHEESGTHADGAWLQEYACVLQSMVDSVHEAAERCNKP